MADGVPVVRGAQLSDGRRFSFSGLVFVSEEKATRHTGNLAYPGDVIVTQRGTIGQVGLVPDPAPHDRYLLSQSQMKISPDPAKADAEFLYFVLRSPESQARLVDHAITAGVPHINLATLREFAVLIPGVPFQRRIAAVLSAFDELIEINEQRIALLEDLARSLYREWFVHFRFPGHEEVDFVDSELGSIPEGWEVRRLDSIARIVMGQSPRSGFSNKVGDGLPFHQGVADYGALLPVHRKFSTLESRTAEAMDVLCSVRAPVGRLNVADKRLVIGRGLAAIQRNDDLQALLLEQLRDGLGEEDSLGGGTIFRAIGKEQLGSLPTLEPTKRVAREFEGAVGPILEERIHLTLQSRHLAATRDLLLPRLVTGRLDVSDIDLGDLLPADAA